MKFIRIYFSKDAFAFVLLHLQNCFTYFPFVLVRQNRMLRNLKKKRSKNDRDREILSRGRWVVS